jgi:hypothetical protein
MTLGNMRPEQEQPDLREHQRLIIRALVQNLACGVERMAASVDGIEASVDRIDAQLDRIEASVCLSRMT